MGRLQPTLEYVEQICGSLSEITKRSGYGMLSYLLNIAQLEAQQQLGTRRVLQSVDSPDINVGLWEWDLAAKLCHVDRTTAALFELTDEECLEGVSETRCLLQIRQDDLPGVQQALSNGKRTGGEFQFGFRVRKTSGVIHWIQAHGSVTRDQNGRARRIVGANIDISP